MKLVIFFIALIKSLKAATTQKRGRGRKLGWEGQNKAAALTECTMANSAEIHVSCHPQPLLSAPQRGGCDWTGEWFVYSWSTGPQGEVSPDWQAGEKQDTLYGGPALLQSLRSFHSPASELSGLLPGVHIGEQRRNQRKRQ